MKLFFIDTETTGLDPQKNGIIQIGGIIEIDGKEKEHINLLVRPFSDDIIDEKALEVNKTTKEKIANFPSPREVYQNLTKTMLKYISKYDRSDKFHFIGYKSCFDDDFLRAWFKKNGDDYFGSYFFYPPIDVMNMAAIHFIETRSNFANFKLMTVAQAIGIEIDEDKAHDAMYDIEITKKLFYKLIEKD